MTGKNVLHNLHMQPTGSQSRILKSERDLACFILSGTRLQILGALEDIVSVPLKTVWTFVNLKGLQFSNFMVFP